MIKKEVHILKVYDLQWDSEVIYYIKKIGNTMYVFDPLNFQKDYELYDGLSSFFKDIPIKVKYC